jgi:hypothetical protein
VSLLLLNVTLQIANKMGFHKKKTKKKHSESSEGSSFEWCAGVVRRVGVNEFVCCVLAAKVKCKLYRNLGFCRLTEKFPRLVFSVKKLKVDGA